VCLAFCTFMASLPRRLTLEIREYANLVEVRVNDSVLSVLVLGVVLVPARDGSVVLPTVARVRLRWTL
jgi:hypothetical protein